MNDFLKRTWAQINLDHLRENVEIIRNRLHPSTQMMGIVKADAYGHGDAFVARELQNMGLCWFGVSNLEEALSLRRAGITGDILILGMTPVQHGKDLEAHNITQAVFSPEYAQALNAAALESGVQVNVHVKLDTGMGRIGFAAESCQEAVRELQECRGLLPTGLFSHFSHADCDGEEARAYTRLQIKRFDQAAEVFKQAFPNLILHLQNSAGIMDYPELSYDLARPGIILYGIAPSNEMGTTLPLKPVMELKSTVAMVKTVEKGTAISYSRTFVAEQPMRVATIPIGYADGYPRLLSNKGEVLIHGRRARVLGNVCMDQMIVDVTGIPETRTGDIVTVFGRDGDGFLPVEELAQGVGTIPYETVCLIGKRVPRTYWKNGNIIGVYDSIA